MDLADLEAAFALHAAHPNPFRSETVIGFDLPGAETVRLTIFDAAGRRVREVASVVYPAGRYRMSWDGRSQSGRAVAPGIYFARITAGDSQSSQRLVRIR